VHNPEPVEQQAYGDAEALHALDEAVAAFRNGTEFLPASSSPAASLDGMLGDTAGPDVWVDGEPVPWVDSPW
jgi:hypothetical protein